MFALLNRSLGPLGSCSFKDVHLKILQNAEHLLRYHEQVGVISDRRLNISEEPRVPFILNLLLDFTGLPPNKTSILTAQFISKYLKSRTGTDTYIHTQ